MKIDLEQQILRNLLTNETYMRKVIPFIKKEYFEGIYRSLFIELTKITTKYNKLPTMEAFKVEIDQSDLFTEQNYTSALDILPTIFEFKPENEEWLLDKTEKWCQDRAVYLAIMESIQIIDGKHNTFTKDALPDILQNALAVCFDTNVGHDYLENVDERFAFYHEQEERIPFDLEYFNTITKGGLPNKTLNIALAGTGVGKSLFMCHVAASALSQGRNVLYITMEMAEERIAERVDANLMNVNVDQLDHMSEKMFKDRVSKIAESTQGKLIIKEYPTGAAHIGHFRALLNELKLKKKFVPEIVFIDYLNICASSRMKGMGGAINSYSYIKAIAEEMRGLAVEFNVPIVSATQTTRSGFSNSDPGLEDTSESFGLPATADLMFALVANEEMDKLGQIMVKQLKNRYNDPNNNKRFIVGIDRSKMRLYDVAQEEQTLIEEDDIPVFEKSRAGERLKNIKFT
jgi:archaellum biogenesis ATPase FlaH